MSSNDNQEVQPAPVAKKGGSEKYVFGLIALIIALTAAYQLFLCPNCYAASDRTAAPPATQQ